jgi:hypothetical protein
MQPLIGGTVVPAYFGSWTFTLDTNQPGKRRWVRMIIIELIQGECMLDIILRAEQGGDMMDYSLLPLEEFRIRVLQNIIEAETTISWETAIDHYDIDTRNIMVKPNGTVVLIDFNQAYIHELSCCGNFRDTKKGNLTILPQRTSSATGITSRTRADHSENVYPEVGSRMESWEKSG